MTRDVLIIVIGVALLALVWIGWGLFETIRGGTQSNERVFCTADAKLCPDGSYVGRVPPHCDFAPCPHTQ